MKCYCDGGIKVFVDVSPDDQQTTTLRGSQTIYRSRSGDREFSVLVSLTPKIPAELIETGSQKEISDYIIKTLAPLADSCVTEVFIGEGETE